MGRDKVKKDNFVIDLIRFVLKMNIGKTVIIFIFLFIQNEARCQLPSFDSIKIEQDTLYYSKPITNREYLTFLLHNFKMLGESYPNYLYSLFPRVQIKFSEVYEMSEKSTFLRVLIETSDSLTKNYIFNPKYLDYPIVGISQYQANYFAQWYTDRLNEYLLIENGITKLDFDSEVDENHFSTESYLLGQFEPTTGTIGITNKIKGLKWANDYNDTMNAISKLFIFGLRLPTAFELKKLHLLEKIVFKAYLKDDFMKIWTDSFVHITNNYLSLNVYNETILMSHKNTNTINFADELSFGNYKDSSLLSVFKNELLELKSMPKINMKEPPVREKNEYGYIDYRILGYNEHQDLLILYDKKDKWNRGYELKPFRLVFYKSITSGMDKINIVNMPK